METQRGAQQLIWNLGAGSPWLKWSHSSPFWELKHHPVSEKPAWKALLQMGLKPPCFFLSARRHPKHRGVWEHFYDGLGSDFPRAYPSQGFLSPLPWDDESQSSCGWCLHIGEHNLVRRLKFPFGEYGKQGTFLNPCVHMCVSARIHVCLRMFWWLQYVSLYSARVSWIRRN